MLTDASPVPAGTFTRYTPGASVVKDGAGLPPNAKDSGGAALSTWTRTLLPPASGPPPGTNGVAEMRHRIDVPIRASPCSGASGGMTTEYEPEPSGRSVITKLRSVRFGMRTLSSPTPFGQPLVR